MKNLLLAVACLCVTSTAFAQPGAVPGIPVSPVSAVSFVPSFVNGPLTVATIMTANNYMTNGTGGSYCVGPGTSRECWLSSADGLFEMVSSAGTIYGQFNTGTARPTVNTCGTGTITATSSNVGGDVTATGATACTIAFGLPNWTNPPFCTITEFTSAVAVRISAISTSAFTVTGLTSGDRFFYNCIGGR